MSVNKIKKVASQLKKASALNGKQAGIIKSSQRKENEEYLEELKKKL